ncbi:MAG: hypothetical protein GF365_05290 [Candidatus Buchananbacteria bacterium]|nr:hypothetical protein [Candidatus Buchananbacteria bacterium]
MIKVRLTYVCQTANFIATKEIKLPFIQEGMQISQIFNSVVADNNEGEIFTIVKIRYLLQENSYIAFIKKASYSPYDRASFTEAGWQTK